MSQELRDSMRVSSPALVVRKYEKLEVVVVSVFTLYERIWNVVLHMLTERLLPPRFRLYSARGCVQDFGSALEGLHYTIAMRDPQIWSMAQQCESGLRKMRAAKDPGYCFSGSVDRQRGAKNTES